MYPLELVYGPKSYRAFVRDPEAAEFLTEKRQTPEEIWKDKPLMADSFPKLLEIVSFLSVMNKRSTLFFRGQGEHRDPIPAIFRARWTSLGKTQHELKPAMQACVWDYLLTEIPGIVDEVCAKFPGPRRSTLKMFREAVWAIAQHYELWPTPLIDVTPNLRVAASFALWSGRGEGQIYVVALPASTNSVTYDADQHTVLARLQAVCPPIAKRPHYQDGYLVGRFPFESPLPNRIDRNPPKVSNLSRRLVARIELKDAAPFVPGAGTWSKASFWNADFPPMSAAALLPSPDDDELLAAFTAHAKRIDEAMAAIRDDA